MFWQQKLPKLPNNAFFSLIFLRCDWLVKKPWNLIGCLFYSPILIGWKKDASWSRKWCDLGINRTAESQSDCKDNQWFQNGFSSSLTCCKNCWTICRVLKGVPKFQEKYNWFHMNWRQKIKLYHCCIKYRRKSLFKLVLLDF